MIQRYLSTRTITGIWYFLLVQEGLESSKPLRRRQVDGLEIRHRGGCRRRRPPRGRARRCPAAGRPGRAPRAGRGAGAARIPASAASPSFQPRDRGERCSRPADEAAAAPASAGQEAPGVRGRNRSARSHGLERRSRRSASCTADGRPAGSTAMARATSGRRGRSGRADSSGAGPASIRCTPSRAATTFQRVVAGERLPEHDSDCPDVGPARCFLAGTSRSGEM